MRSNTAQLSFNDKAVLHTLARGRCLTCGRPVDVEAVVLVNPRRPGAATSYSVECDAHARSNPADVGKKSFSRELRPLYFSRDSTLSTFIKYHPDHPFSEAMQHPTADTKAIMTGYSMDRKQAVKQGFPDVAVEMDQEFFEVFEARQQAGDAVTDSLRKAAKAAGKILKAASAEKKIEGARFTTPGQEHLGDRVSESFFMGTQEAQEGLKDYTRVRDALEAQGYSVDVQDLLLSYQNALDSFRLGKRSKKPVSPLAEVRELTGYDSNTAQTLIDAFPITLHLIREAL